LASSQQVEGRGRKLGTEELGSKLGDPEFRLGDRLTVFESDVLRDNLTVIVSLPNR
jgi:hypothetical protein